MPDVEKRLRYFDGQFLQAQDFIDEQTYHIDRQQRHNRQFHTSGIAEGLPVTADTGSAQVEVGPGTAVDSEGRLIVLASSRTVTLSTHANQTVLLLISYGEEASDPATVGGGGDTRWHERPNVEAVPELGAPAAGTHIRLARLVISEGGTVSEHDPGVRVSAGVRVGDELELRRLTLSRSGVDASQWPRLSSGAAGRADLSGNLRVTGNLNVEGTIQGDIADGSIGPNELANNAVTTPKLDNNAVTAAKIADGSIGPNKLANDAVTAAKIADGNVISVKLASNAVTGDKIAVGTINETKFDGATRGRLVTNGDGHDHVGGRGATIRHSALNKDDGRNPHGTTAADVGALPTSGGIFTGELRVRKGSASATVLGADSGSAQNLFGMESAKNFAVFISGGENPNVSGGTKTALLIWPLESGVQGLQINSSTGGVDTMIVHGTARFTGNKIGYVTDSFVNGSGEVLRTGDVVKLNSSGTVRFHGENNRIPIPEVTLADSENDPLVIGIVDQEATPAPGEPDRRAEPDDPTSIPDGGELFVVTLGTYAHCKVDATEAPIEVGDLLTTSSKPGHARKATDPKLGTIIGKALEPLAEGTGYIAVFVNIQ